jgi:DNA-directed RNA polymerase specialized sigma24 family protein
MRTKVTTEGQRCGPLGRAAGTPAELPSGAHAASADDSDAPCPVAASPDQLIHEHLASIYSLIYSSVGNRQDTEELTSRVFQTAWHNREGRDMARTQDFLLRQAHAVVAGYWRTFTQTSQVVAGSIPAGDEGAPQAPVAPPVSSTQRAERICALLPARERTVLTQRLLLNRSTAETAELMRLSETEVKRLLYRALTMAAELDTGVR